jgi:hypothetical protein
MDLISSAEWIFFQYLSPAGSGNSYMNREIYLPPALRIHSFPLSSTREPKTQNELALVAQIPNMFQAQKEYCYRALEQDAYPRFLRSKAFGNLTPISALLRLLAGFLVLWVGLSVGFSLIFLDVYPKSRRFYVSVFYIYSAATLTDIVTVIHPIHNRELFHRVSPVRTRPHPRLLLSIRNNTLSHATHPRAIRQKANSCTGSLCLHTRSCLVSGTYTAFLGGTRSQAIIQSHPSY